MTYNISSFLNSISTSRRPSAYLPFGNPNTGVVGRINSTVNRYTSPASTARNNFTSSLARPPVGAIGSKVGGGYLYDQSTPSNPGATAPPATQNNSQTPPPTPQYRPYQEIPNMPQTPETPTPQPEAPSYSAPSTKGYEDAYAKYIASLSGGGNVTKAQQAYNDFIANQSKSVAGLSGQGRGIPLTIVRGEQQRLLEQTQPEAQRLQNDIGIAQDEYGNVVKSNEAGVNYQKSLLDLQNEDAKNQFTREQASYDRMTNAQKTKFDQDLATKKFDEDKRQFGLQYALSKQKASTSGASATGTSELKSSALSSGQELINKLGTRGFKSSVGAKGAFSGNLFGLFGQRDETGAGSGTARANFSSQLNNFSSLLQLDAAKYLKGQGALSDSERRILSNASANLNTSQSEAEFEKNLRSIVGALQSAEQKNLAISGGSSNGSVTPSGISYTIVQ